MVIPISHLTREFFLLTKYIFEVLPRVDRELAQWEAFLEACPDPALRRQALNSINLKRFHAQGGSVFALWRPGWENGLVSFIVSFQTISDYLDNLCDRMSVLEAESFRLLHLSMLDCLSPSGKDHDYYLLYPHQDDGGYLRSLVKRTRASLFSLPGIQAALPQMRGLVSLYSDLQTYKHMELEKRRPALEHWAEENSAPRLGMEWWEFSAAAGSTLGVFALAAAATQPDLTREECDRLVDAYFPWICGLHILLDYLIDQEEDLKEGDFNFTRWYPDDETIVRRMLLFIRQSFSRAAGLPCPAFHALVVKGLLALYLSDPKASQPGLDEIARALLSGAGRSTRTIYGLCRLIRNSRIIRRRYPHLRPVKS